MMKLQQIAKAAKLNDSDSVRTALQKMHDVPDHELHFYLVLRDTLQATSQETRQAITFAQVESDRRTNARASRLAIITTIISGIVGLLGVALGRLTNA